MEKYIVQILEKNNRVIVPDFGAFIVKQRKPLTIVFNEFLQYNDGMLVDTVSKSEDLDREKAKEKIDEFVKSILVKLDSGKTYPFENLGVLIKNSAGKISLEGDDAKVADTPKPAAKSSKKEVIKEENKANDEKVKGEVEKKPEEDKIKKEQEKIAKEEKAKAEKEEKEKEKQAEKTKAEEMKKMLEEKNKAEQEKKEQAEKERQVQEKSSHEKMKSELAQKTVSSQPSKKFPNQSSITETKYQKKKSSKRNLLLWVVVIVLINGILITGYFIYNKDLPGLFKKAETDDLLLDQPVIEEDNYVTESYDEASESTIKEELVPDQQKISPTPKQSSISQGKRYYIVAGAFINEQNADNLVIDLRQKGYNSEKFGKIGSLHAVSYGVFSNKSDADNLLNKIQTEVDTQAWIKRVD